MPTSNSRRRPGLRLEPLEARDVPALVTATNDVDDYSPADSADWDGPNNLLSLPEAIRQVNAGADSSIGFAVGTVTLTKPLAPITLPVTLTGMLAGGAPGTVIDGAGVNTGLTLAGGGVAQNLIIQGFAGSYGMSISGTADVLNCFFGTKADGLEADGNAGAGLVIQGGTVRNSLFSGNAGVGLRVTGTATIENNRFGTDVGGRFAIPNTADGLVLTGPASVVRNNVLSGNGANGVSVRTAAAVGNVIAGNLIGVGADGTTAVGNGGSGVYIGNADGVLIGTGARKTVVGGTTTADRNVIAGNGQHGVWLERAGPYNLVLGNWIGLAGTGTVARPNGGDGVFIHITKYTTVGGTLGGSGNIISGNTGAGVHIEAVAGQFPATTQNKLLGNWIGLGATGLALGNAGGGVLIGGGATYNTVGGTVAGSRNVISGNTIAGLALTGVGTKYNPVLGNFIGTDVSGTLARPNEVGVGIDGGATYNTVGGSTAAARNLISGNSKSGVYIGGLTAKFNRVVGNFIGTRADGQAALGNTEDGVRIDGAARTVVGGTTAGLRNLISGNGRDGVAILGVPGDLQQNVVIGNYIGTAVAGSAALGNGGAGVSVTGGDKNRVGGTTVGERNTISGNAVGVDVGTGATLTSVLGNYIGTDPTGKFPVPNQTGVHVAAGATLTTLGGIYRSHGNVVAGNTGDGVRLDGPTKVRNNLIGTDRAQTLNLGNWGNGVSVTSVGSVIGGSGALANVIANNHQYGVLVSAGSGNTISSNRIYNSGSLGISVVGGANGSLAPPQFESILASTLIIVTGWVTSRPSATVRLELFGNSFTGADPFGSGEGERFMAAAATVKTDATGHFTAYLRCAVQTAFPVLSLTATDAGGNTSAFSFNWFT